jgi:hypothetical protein
MSLGLDRAFVDAIEEVYRLARCLGLSPEALYTAQAPWQLRADAWCHRVDRLLSAPISVRREVAA